MVTNPNQIEWPAQAPVGVQQQAPQPTQIPVPTVEVILPSDNMTTDGGVIDQSTGLPVGQ